MPLTRRVLIRKTAARAQELLVCARGLSTPERAPALGRKSDVYQVLGLGHSRTGFVFERRGVEVEVFVDGGRVREVLREQFGERSDSLRVACSRSTLNRLEAALEEVGAGIAIEWAGATSKDGHALSVPSRDLDLATDGDPDIHDLGTALNTLVVRGPNAGAGVAIGDFRRVVSIEVTGFVWLFSRTGWGRDISVTGSGAVRLYRRGQGRWSFERKDAVQGEGV